MSSVRNSTAEKGLKLGLDIKSQFSYQIPFFKFKSSRGRLDFTLCTFGTKRDGPLTAISRNACNFTVAKAARSLSSKTTKILSYDLKRQLTKPDYEKAKKKQKIKTKQKLTNISNHPSPCVEKCCAWPIQKTNTGSQKRKTRRIKD